MVTSLNLICLRASDPDKLVSFYGKLGLSFRREKHGTGPEHHSCDLGGSVFEIYPLVSGQSSTAGARLGFSVSSIAEAIRELDTDAYLVSQPKQTHWGRRAVLQDPEGHKVELVERAAS